MLLAAFLSQRILVWRLLHQRPSAPSPKSLRFRRRSVGCFSRRERSAHIWIHTGRASNAEKQPTGRGPEGCVENGPAAALLVGYVSIEICALLAPCRQPILNATTSPLYARRCTRYFLRSITIKNTAPRIRWMRRAAVPPRTIRKN